MPNPANPQNWNRYSYVINSPIKFVDPSGHTGKLPPCWFCNILWFDYSSTPQFVEDVLDFTLSPICDLVIGCNVNRDTNQVWGPTEHEYFTSAYNNVVIISGVQVPKIQLGTKGTTVDDLAYRYVDDGEAAVIEESGKIPNVDQRGYPKEVSTSPNYYETVVEAEDGLLLGSKNLGGATNPPTYRATYLRNSVTYSYAGNSQTGKGIEMITQQEIKILKLEKLLQ